MFEWIFKLTDQLSGPAKRAADALGEVDRKSRGAEQGVHNFVDEIQRAQRELGKIKSDAGGFDKLIKAQRELSQVQGLRRLRSELAALKADPSGFKEMVKAQKELAGLQDKLTKEAGGGDVFGWKSAALAAAAVLIAGAFKVGQLVKDGFVAAVGEAKEFEKLRLSARLTLGGEDKGRAFLKESDRISGLTAFDDDVVAKLMQPLNAAGFDDQAARTAFAAASDLAAQRGQGQEGVHEAIAQITRLKLGGTIDKRHLVGFGVDAKAFWEDLGKQLGVSGEQAEKLGGQGKIETTRMLNALYEGIERRQGGELGTGAIAAGQTLDARIQKLMQLPGDMLKPLVDSPGYKMLNEALAGVLKTLDPSGPLGQKIMGGLGDVFTTLSGWVKEALDPANIEAFASGIERAISFGRDLWSIFSDVFGILRSVWGVLSDVGVIDLLVGGVQFLVGLLKEAFGFIRSVVDSVKEAIESIPGFKEGPRDETVDRVMREAGFTRPEEKRAVGDPSWLPFEVGSLAGSDVPFGPSDVPHPVHAPTSGNSVSISAPMTFHFDGSVDKEKAADFAAEFGRHMSSQLERARAEAGR